jgi:peptide/nickel transport system permease protein
MSSSIVSLADIWSEFRRSKVGMLGLSILLLLMILSAIALTTGTKVREWNDPSVWSYYPRNAMPSWVNLFTDKRLTEHLILSYKDISVEQSSGVKQVRHTFTVDYIYDTLPTDIIMAYKVNYQGSALLQASITRPDGEVVEYARISLPSSMNKSLYESRLSSNDRVVQDTVSSILERYDFPIERSDTLTPVFYSYDGEFVKGRYILTLTFFLFNADDEVLDTMLVMGGRVYGLLGTDELRRDLSIGVIWGAPLALFIGVSVASISVMIGMMYGIVSGYRGGRIDEGMMRLNDVVYALPALPLLILLAVSIGRSVLLIVAYLIIFGWVGIAKVSRSITLQIKNLAYIEAAELMGQSSMKIILRHIFPQLLPYTFASIAISVPGAIITEAGLSFLGLGDPTMPTWGQILHDANLYGAAARGLWWWIVPPGLMIALTGLAFVLVGNALDAIVNPRIRRL